MLRSSRFHISYIISFSAIFSFSISFATAKVSNEDDAVIEVSAQKLEQEISVSVEQKSVLSEEQIQKSGAKTVGDALKNLPEITVNNASAGNANESISMQGLGNGYVKIMIDGVAVSSDLDGSTPIFQIPVENIERIEVSKGADSVLYGSEAMGGTINIITKKNDDNSTEKIKIAGNLTEEFGYSPSISNWKNYTAGTFFAGGNHFSNSLAACLNYVPGKEKSAFDALAGNITYYENTQKILGFVRDTLSYKDEWGNVSLYGLYADSEQKSNFTKTGYDKGAEMEYRSFRGEGGLNAKYIFGDDFYIDAFSAGKFYFMNTTYDVKAGSYSSSASTKSDSFDWESDVRSHWKMNESNDFILGLNADLESIDGSSFDERKYALETAFFVQDTISLFDEKFSLVPGFRIDYSPEIQGSSVNFMATPKLALKYTPTEYTAFRLSYGMGYKMPSLKEKHWIFRHSYAPGAGNFILYGNPDLKSEKSHSFNAEIEKNVANYFKINLGGYFNYIIDLIDSVVTDASSSPQIREYQNVDKAITYGGEISFVTELERFKGRIGYAYTEAKSFDEENEEWLDLALRVRHRITASAEYLIPVLESAISLNAQWNSSQLISTGTEYYSPDYLMLNAAISKKLLDDKLEIYFGADNILNNAHFKKGTNGENQKNYYGLEEGTTLRIGGKVRIEK
ncbi:MAG: TonB-dependent receptor [Treponema sp.]|nr:TonB-dependent receptor [Treponema sp.]